MQQTMVTEAKNKTNSKALIAAKGSSTCPIKAVTGCVTASCCLLSLTSPSCYNMWHHGQCRVKINSSASVNSTVTSQLSDHVQYWDLSRNQTSTSTQLLVCHLQLIADFFVTNSAVTETETIHFPGIRKKFVRLKQYKSEYFCVRVKLTHPGKLPLWVNCRPIIQLVKRNKSTGKSTR